MNETQPPHSSTTTYHNHHVWLYITILVLASATSEADSTVTLSGMAPFRHHNSDIFSLLT